MRHGNKVKKLNRTKSHREAMLVNLMDAVFMHYSIVTTVQKAKETKRFIDRVLTFAKGDKLSAYRHLNRLLRNNKKVIKQIFTTIIPRVGERKSGYTRIIRLPPRKGDGAQLVLLELIGFEDERKKRFDAREAERKEREEKQLRGGV